MQGLKCAKKLPIVIVCLVLNIRWRAECFSMRTNKESLMEISLTITKLRSNLVPEVSKIIKHKISWITKTNRINSRVSNLKEEIQKSEVKIFKVFNLWGCAHQIRAIMINRSLSSPAKFIKGIEIVIMINRSTS